MESLLEDLRKELKQKSDIYTYKSIQKFFKENIKAYGIKSKDINRISKEYFKRIEHLEKKQIFKYCTQLYQSGYLEEANISSNWSYRKRKEYTKEDIYIFEEWIDKYIDNWAKCDTFCNHTVGTIVDMYPELINILKEWSNSPNIWLKRASAVSLIVPAREGIYLTDIFEISNTLLLDQNDMVQKGYGWLLKEASKKHQQEIYEYVLSKRKIMPRTSLRYAIEKMPLEMKKEAMKK